MVKRISSRKLITGLFLFVVILSVSCRTIKNYDDGQEPVFKGDYAENDPARNGAGAGDSDPEQVIKVVTWNIAFARDVDQAIAELREAEEIKEADILLLQEMDEDGVEEIARALSYNYVYYPASIHHRNQKNFGNAVLSKWPILNSKKLILPHENPQNDQIRIAVRALVDINGTEAPVYSVHTETFWLGPKKRTAQVDFLADDIIPAADYVIAGGDFNTLTPASVETLEERLGERGLERVTLDGGPTVIKGGFGVTLDHIFAKGFITLDNGSWPESEASDHAPVWVDLIFN